VRWGWWPLLLALLAGCSQDMDEQPKLEPFEADHSRPGEQMTLPLVLGTVARGHLPQPVPRDMPLEVDMDLLARGKERFEIFCTPCHGPNGRGNGMIVQRGFPPPPSFHSDRLRLAPDRHFYRVITEGFGVMYSYASRVPEGDRWAITAYIRALQLARYARVEDLPEGVAMPDPAITPVNEPGTVPP